jgi:hypothetical protein
MKIFKKLVWLPIFLLIIICLSNTVSAANWTVGSNNSFGRFST